MPPDVPLKADFNETSSFVSSHDSQREVRGLDDIHRPDVDSGEWLASEGYSSLSLLRYCWDKKKKYHNIQTIEISSIKFECFVVVGILIWYHDKQHFELSGIVIIMRHYCIINHHSFNSIKGTRGFPLQNVNIRVQ